ncbi:MAG TPA: arginine--tRNA ligase [Anaerovoracaceae bacterium]|nr:arginine--tRNA ligase [Anaerovoracaceae bacterium]
MIDFKNEIAKIIYSDELGLDIEEIKNMVEVPTDSSMGDYAFPCFRLAKVMRKAPPLIAKSIVLRISEDELFSEVKQVNAYVNMFVNKKVFVKDVIEEVIEDGKNFGKSNIGEGKSVIVEYSSPNIAKPFHIGHIRSTVIGNSLYKIYEAIGYNVIRINHLGDYGTQFGKMIVAYRHWGNEEDVKASPIQTLLEYYTKFHIEVESNPKLDDEARETFTKLENREEEELKLWKWFRDESLKEFYRVYKMLDIEFDSLDGESFYSDRMPRFLKELKDRGLMVDSQGAQIVDLEEYGMNPALITKSDGSTLYVTRDIAAAVYRKETYDFEKNIYVVASQQNLHFKQWMKVLELLGYDWVKDCVHVPFGLVSLEEGTMSTRHGRVVFLEDVLNRAIEKTKDVIKEKDTNADDIEETAKMVGIGAVIFQELSNGRIKDYVFSWDKVLNFDGETGPYVQYNHARAASLMRKAGEEVVNKAEGKEIEYDYLTSESAYNLAKEIYRLPEVVKEAAYKYEPSIVTRQIVNIAQAFNRFYRDEYILVDNEKEKIAKMALVIASKTALNNGLGLLGIKAPEKM